MAKLKLQLSKYDYQLLFLVLGISIFGLLMVYNASVVIATRDFSDKYFYFKNQGIWFGLGIVLLFITSRIDYHIYQKWALPIFLVAIGLLIAVFLPGIGGLEVLGAKRRVNLGPVGFQPAESVKLATTIFLAGYFASHKEIVTKKIIPFLVILGVLLGLIILQPDMGTAMIVVGTGLGMFFLAGGNLSYFLILAPFLAAGAIGLILVAPYRLARLKTLIDPTTDLQGAGYHINQVLIALGNGGLLGLGLGKSRQKFEYIPEVATDSIFAVIAEELGFIKVSIVILLFLFILLKIINIAQKAPDKFGQLLAGGIAVYIGIQVLFNLGSMVALVPLTGVPLPFISYGGSSLIVNLAAIGIVLNISRQAVVSKR
ncbi:MAG TPA: putative lipid II flippase FtsW [Patescibacteria group bacterium]